jgi:hypothetical protein
MLCCLISGCVSVWSDRIRNFYPCVSFVAKFAADAAALFDL